METAVYCPRDAKVADVLVKAGSIVAAQDLLVTLEGDGEANGTQTVFKK